MNSINRGRWAALTYYLLASHATLCRGPAEGIPEPSLVFYGAVRDAATNQRLIYGTISWTFQTSNGDPPVVLTAPLTNLLDQFSYVLLVPVEMPLPGSPANSNALKLASSPLVYNRAEVTIDGMPASLAPPAAESFQLGILDRGRVERIDLVVAGSFVDSDGNGLPDSWEWAFFEMVGVDPDADADGDGVNNRDEWKAGTDPTDPNSLFAFIRIEHPPSGGITIEWSSASNKVYSILRSGTVTGGFLPVQTGVEATPPINTYLDATALGAGPFFYLLQVEE